MINYLKKAFLIPDCPEAVMQAGDTITISFPNSTATHEFVFDGKDFIRIHETISETWSKELRGGGKVDFI